MKGNFHVTLKLNFFAISLIQVWEFIRIQWNETNSNFNYFFSTHLIFMHHNLPYYYALIRIHQACTRET